MLNQLKFQMLQDCFNRSGTEIKGKPVVEAKEGYVKNKNKEEGNEQSQYKN